MSSTNHLQDIRLLTCHLHHAHNGLAHLVRKVRHKVCPCCPAYSRRVKTSIDAESKVYLGNNGR